MKYKSIELCNYAGIYNGMGLSQISIDFTKCITNKIIIKGKNGSGKSTLLNAINPNPDSNDNFIPNAEARKTLVLTNNGVDYIIRYIHPVNNNGSRGTTKGYISKLINGNMVELNPNGNISSCKDIIYSEFNLDANYLSLAKLTTENRGLVDSKPAERKKLINSIINNLETYNNIFKILSKKASTYKSLINSLVTKIDYLGNEAQLNSRLGNITGRISSLEEERDTTLGAIAAVKLRISEYIKILRDNNYDSIVEELKDAKSTVKTLSASINNKLISYGIDDINKIQSFMDDIYKQIVSLESKYDSIKSRIPILIASKESELSSLKIKQEKLSSLQSDYNYIDIKRAIDEAKIIIDSHNEVFNKMKLMDVNIITKDEFNSAMEALRYLKESAYNLTSSYNIADIRECVINRSYIIDNISNIHSLRAELTEKRDLLNKLNTEYSVFISKREIAKDLINRPSGCTINDCPYIKNALLADKKYPEGDMIALENNISLLSNEIDILDKTINKLVIYNEIIGFLSNIERELNSNIGFIKKLPIRKDFKESFINRILDMDRFEDIDELYRFVDCGNMIEEYKNAMEQLHRYEVEYKLYESRNIIIESMISDIDNINKKIDNIVQEINEDSEKISEMDIKLSELKDIYDKLKILLSKINDSLIPTQKRVDELTVIKETLDNNTSELDTLERQLGTLNANMNNITNDIKVLSEEKDEIKHSLVMLTDYKKELALYQDSYTKIDKIRYYASPSTGIQTLYMQLYMNNVISTANNLLSLLFDGEFILQPFIINEQEFRIPCLGSGLLHDDISSMSTAQKSMISMILSYSILHQSSGVYNIISLDEMDGSLDGSNRLYFMTLLDNIMRILGCEQCFIISHNSELISEMADIIMLKDDPGTNYGGNVIWKY